jgi:hypothetical protein
MARLGTCESDAKFDEQQITRNSHDDQTTVNLTDVINPKNTKQW